MSEDAHTDINCTCAICIKGQLTDTIKEYQLIQKFIQKITNIIDTVTLLIASLTVSSFNSETTKMIHSKLKVLYKFDETFSIETPIVFSFIVLLKVYGSCIINIKNYNDKANVIKMLNKINVNQNDILDNVIFYQKKAVAFL